MRIEVQEILKAMKGKKKKGIVLSQGDQLYHLPRVPFRKMCLLLKTGTLTLSWNDSFNIESTQWGSGISILQEEQVSNVVSVSYKNGSFTNVSNFRTCEEVEFDYIFLPNKQRDKEIF